VVPPPASSASFRTRHRALPRDAPHNRRRQCALLLSHSLELDQGTLSHLTALIRVRNGYPRVVKYRFGSMKARATRSTYWVPILAKSSFSSWTPIRSRKSTVVRYRSHSRTSPYSIPLRVSFSVRTRYLTDLSSLSTAKSFALKATPSYNTHQRRDIGVDVDGDLGSFLIRVNAMAAMRGHQRDTLSTHSNFTARRPKTNNKVEWEKLEE
jgi:hypothetical protein